MADHVIQQNITIEDGGQFVMVRTYPKHLTKMPHYRVFDEGMMQVIQHGNLTGQDFKVLLFMLSNMEWENLFKMSQGAIAEALGLRQQHVSKSIQRLVALDLIRVIGNIGRQNIYRVSPYLALKSKGRNLAPMLTEWDGIQTA